MNETSTFTGYEPIVQTATVTGDELRLTLDCGATLSLPVRQVRPLAHLCDDQLKGVRAVTGGTILMWPEAGASVMVEALLEAATGLKTAATSSVKSGKTKKDSST